MGSSAPWQLLFEQSEIAFANGSYDEARRLLHSSIAATGGRVDGWRLFLLGEIERISGDHDAAEHHNDSAHQLALESADRKLFLSTMVAKAKNQRTSAELASGLLNAVWTLAIESKNELAAAEAACELVRISRPQDGQEWFETWSERSIASFRRAGRPLGVAEVLFWLAVRRNDSQRFEDSLEPLREARRILSLHRDVYREILVLWELSRTLLHVQNNQGPNELAEEALDCLCVANRLVQQSRRSFVHAVDRELYNLSVTGVRFNGIGLAAQMGRGAELLEMLEAERVSAMTLLLRDTEAFDEQSSAYAGALAELKDLEVELYRLTSASRAPLNGIQSIAEVEERASNIRQEIGYIYDQIESAVGTSVRKQMTDQAVDLDETLAAIPPNTHVLVLDYLAVPNSIGTGITGCAVAVYLHPGSHQPTDTRIDAHFATLSLEEERWILSESVLRSLGRERTWTQDRWRLPEDVARKLLPHALRQALLTCQSSGLPANLVIIPGAALWDFPFLNLTVNEGVALIDLAVVNFLPSLGSISMASRRDVSPTKGVACRNGFYYGYGVAGLDVERAAWSKAFGAAGLESLDSSAALLECLSGNEACDIGVISCHGDARPGLRHSLILDDRETLSAAQLLGLMPPRLLILGACWSGKISYGAGGEPMALATVALIKGADVVVCGIHELPSNATATILANLYGRLAAGENAGRALRESQLEMRRAQLNPRLWAGLIAIGAG